MIKKALLSIITIVFFSSSLHAISESDIKQVYLERFSMFIDWRESPDEFNVCIYNDEKFANELMNKDNKYSKGKSVKIKSIKFGSTDISSENCNILYLRNIKYKQDMAFINDISTENMLIISDNYDDIHRGVMISFYLEKNRYRFAINRSNLNRAGLKVSYKLLRFAKVVDNKGDNDAE